MDEVFCKINGKRVYLWRAVDKDGQTIDILAKEKRDSKAATRFIKKIRKSTKQILTKVTTDKLKSDIKPVKMLFSTTPHITQQPIIELKTRTNQHGLERRKCVALSH